MSVADALRDWFDSLTPTQGQVDAKRREDLLYYFQAATAKCVRGHARGGREEVGPSRRRRRCRLLHRLRAATTPRTRAPAAPA